MSNASGRGRSLQRRLVWTVCVFAITLAIAAGAVAYLVFRSHLYHQFDHSLGDKIRFFEGFCVQREGYKRISFVMPNAVWEELNNAADPDYFEYRMANGEPFWLSRSLDSNDLPDIGASADLEFQNLTLPGGIPGRCVGRTFRVQQEDADAKPVYMRVVVAHPSDHLEQALAQFLKLSLLSIGAATGILLLAAAWVVRQSLKPLNSLTRQIEGTSLGDTATRFELPAAPSELEPVVDRMNGLMDRVATALEHERQFTSDAAHELRNPVAAIRMQLELALRRPRSIDEYQETIRRVLEVDKHLAVLLDNLLLLARLEAGDERFEPAEIDLAETIDTVWQDFASAAEAKGIGVSKHYREGSRPIRTVHDLLAIALRNLFDNAVDYTPAGGAIEVVTDVEGDRLAITIANTDPGVVPERIGELFRRFRRADPAHDETPQHSGIGLNICSKVAEILNGSITARVVGGMVHFELELPLSPHKPTPSSD